MAAAVVEEVTAAAAAAAAAAASMTEEVASAEVFSRGGVGGSEKGEGHPAIMR